MNLFGKKHARNISEIEHDLSEVKAVQAATYTTGANLARNAGESFRDPEKFGVLMTTSDQFAERAAELEACLGTVQRAVGDIKRVSPPQQEQAQTLLDDMTKEVMTLAKDVESSLTRTPTSLKAHECLSEKAEECIRTISVKGAQIEKLTRK